MFCAQRPQGDKQYNVGIQLYGWYLEMRAQPQLLLGALPLTNCDVGKWLSLRLPFHSRDNATAVARVQRGKECNS